MRARILWWILSLPLLGGCLATPVAVANTENPELAAELMFSHDGCRIYRFRDGGQPVYWADCRGPDGGSASTAWRRRCGKNCSRPVLMTTAEPQAGP
jgi:hypothetical protein